MTSTGHYSQLAEGTYFGSYCIVYAPMHYDPDHVIVRLPFGNPELGYAENSTFEAARGEEGFYWVQNMPTPYLVRELVNVNMRSVGAQLSNASHEWLRTICAELRRRGVLD